MGGPPYCYLKFVFTRLVLNCTAVWILQLFAAMNIIFICLTWLTIDRERNIHQYS